MSEDHAAALHNSVTYKTTSLRKTFILVVIQQSFIWEKNNSMRFMTEIKNI